METIIGILCGVILPAFLIIVGIISLIYTSIIYFSNLSFSSNTLKIISFLRSNRSDLFVHLGGNIYHDCSL